MPNPRPTEARAKEIYQACAHPKSKTQVCVATGLSQSSVKKYVNWMLKHGLLKHGDTRIGVATLYGQGRKFKDLKDCKDAPRGRKIAPGPNFTALMKAFPLSRIAVSKLKKVKCYVVQKMEVGDD